MSRTEKRQPLDPRTALAIIIGVPANLMLILLIWSLDLEYNPGNPGSWDDLGSSILLFYFSIIVTIVTAGTSIWGMRYGISLNPKYRYYAVIAGVITLIPILLAFTILAMIF